MSSQELNDYVKIVEISGKPFAVMEQLERSASIRCATLVSREPYRGFVGSPRDGFLKASSLEVGSKLMKLELGQRHQEYCTLLRCNHAYVIVSFIPGFRLSIV
jgi:hypothetical protein